MRRLLIGLVVAVAAGVALFQLGALAVVKTYKMPAGSQSMEPAVRPGDRVGVVRFIGRIDPDRGDIVAFRTPGRAARLCGQGGIFLKRIVGLPGERISERRGDLFVDGRRLDEPYVRGRRQGALRGSWLVERGAFFVVGDNRRQSCDSRVWGSLPRRALIGEVFLTYWPPTRLAIR